jgi:hypothetical protein
MFKRLTVTAPLLAIMTLEWNRVVVTQAPFHPLMGALCKRTFPTARCPGPVFLGGANHEEKSRQSRFLDCTHLLDVFPEATPGISTPNARAK